MRLIPMLLMLILFHSGLFAQADTARMRFLVVKDARRSILATYNNDIEVALSYVHPELLKAAGGIAAVRKQFQNESKNETRNVPVIDLKITTPKKIVLHQGTAQCTFVYTIKIKSADTIATAVSNIIGISDETLKKWYFLDAQTLSLEQVRFAMPMVSAELSYMVDEETEQAQNKIEWEIKPFLAAKTIDDYNVEYGQIIFKQGSYDTRDDKEGLADVNGTIIVEAKYSFIYGSEHALEYVTRGGRSYIVRRKTPKIVENEEEMKYLTFDDETIDGSGYVLSKVDNNTFVIKDKKGNMIRELKAQRAWTRKGWIIYDNNEKYGVLNRFGKESIPYGKFEWTAWFKNGVSTVARLTGEGDALVIIDTLGNILNSFTETTLYEGEENQRYFKSVKDSRWGVVDFTGKVIIEPTYEHISLSEEDVPVFVGGKLPDGMMSIYNFKEENLFPEVFDFADIKDKYFLTESRAKKILNIYSAVDFKLIKTFTLKESQIVNTFQKDEKTGRVFLALSTGWSSKFLYPLDGTPFLDERTGDHHLLYGCIKYYKDGKYGIISTTGEEIIPPIFEDVTFLSDSQTYWAKQDGKWGLLKIKP